jgi:hypothetical protein
VKWLRSAGAQPVCNPPKRVLFGVLCFRRTESPSDPAPPLQGEVAARRADGGVTWPAGIPFHHPSGGPPPLTGEDRRKNGPALFAGDIIPLFCSWLQEGSRVGLLPATSSTLPFLCSDRRRDRSLAAERGPRCCCQRTPDRDGAVPNDHHNRKRPLPSGSDLPAVSTVSRNCVRTCNRR